MKVYTVDNCKGKRVEVSLNGVLLSHVLWAIPEGRAVCHAVAPLKLNESDELVHTISYGEVEVKVYE